MEGSQEKKDADEKGKGVAIPPERIATLIGALQFGVQKAGSIRSLASELGCSEATMRRYLSAKTYPDVPVLFSIADFTGVETAQLFEPTDVFPPVKKPNLSAEYVEVPRYDVEVAAGDGRFPQGEKKLKPLAFRRDELESWNLPIDQLAIVTARGDSMPGYVRDGGPVMMNMADTAIGSGAIYVARMRGELIIKRMQLVPGGIIRVISTSDEYPNFDIVPEREPDFVVLGRAVWSDRRL